MVKAVVPVLAILIAAGGTVLVVDAQTASRAANHTSAVSSPRTARDVMPPEVETTPLLDGMGIEPGSSRRFDREAAPPAWLVRASGGKLCFMSGGAAGCAPESVLTDRGLLPQIAWTGGVLRVEGVAADSVKGLRVTFQDEAVENVPVRDGTFLLTTEKVPRLLEWTDVHGPQSLSVSLPPDLLATK